jgi:hypothetical protein
MTWDLEILKRIAWNHKGDSDDMIASFGSIGTWDEFNSRIIDVYNLMEIDEFLAYDVQIGGFSTGLGGIRVLTITCSKSIYGEYLQERRDDKINQLIL